ncbi:MAG: homoserine dehydrogenase [Candidatus Thorarchaeota archaeon]
MYRLAFIGFGVVGQGLLEILVEKQNFLKQEYGFEWKLVAISDIVKGCKYNPDGLNATEILDEVKLNGNITNISATYNDWDSLKTIKESNADIVIEVSYTDIKTGEPGLTHVKAAIETKKHVTMTNKGPMVVASTEIFKLASKNKVMVRYEGTVMSGTPVLMTGIRSLKASGIHKIRGILNGTTNFILTQMEQGLGYDKALKKAQELGYAEAKPEGDVEGWDALGKVIILANTLMGTKLKINDVYREGITRIKNDDIKNAASDGMKWKLIGEVSRESNGEIKASVRPIKVPISHPLAGISGPTNALTFTTELLGEVTIIGPGAGKKATGFALLSDLLDIHSELQSNSNNYS